MGGDIRNPRPPFGGVCYIIISTVYIIIWYKVHSFTCTFFLQMCVNVCVFVTRAHTPLFKHQNTQALITMRAHIKQYHIKRFVRNHTTDPPRNPNHPPTKLINRHQTKEKKRKANQTKEKHSRKDICRNRKHDQSTLVS